MPKCLGLLSLFVFLLASFSGISGQNPCPEPSDILPCTCIHDESLNAGTVDCSEAGSIDEIFSVFNEAPWPHTEFTRFNLTYNEGIQEIPEGVFGEVSFEEIFIYRTPISNVHPTAILPLKDRLWDLRIGYGALASFPWNIIPELPNLVRISLYGNAFTVWPLLESDSVEIIILSGNSITFLEPGFHLPKLRVLDVAYNPISAIQPGFFSYLPSMEIFHCLSCSLGPILGSWSLEFFNQAIQEVHLEENFISILEPDAIRGLTVDTQLYLSSNYIRELTEEVFRPMLEVLSRGNGYIDLYGNPVDCDCSIAWIVLNPDFLSSVLGECLGGYDFQDLDPSMFEEFC